ncbi:MAG: hypothetical protein C4547_11240 [Phycisphaerales bacterium]|nr:MAG: hypothetical protein C4547_11240 [Phycisphaerales bacterium]
MSCNAELRGFGAFHEEFRKLGVTLAAVSVDSPEQSRRVVEARGLPFPILADQEQTLIGALGLVHAGGGPGGADIAIPAHVLVDRQGRILWRYVSDKVQNRLDPSDVLEHVRSAIGP